MALIQKLAGQGRATFTATEAREASRTVGIADSYLSVLLHRLHHAGWVCRLKHGTYALSMGLFGAPEAHPFVLGMALIEPCAISGWAALNHHGLTEQIPRVITLTTPKRVVTPAMRGGVQTAASTWEVAGQQFQVVTVVPAHYFGVEEIWMGDARVRMFDRERTLLDCFALPRRFGGLAEGRGILEEHLHDLDLGRLIAHAQRYPKVVVAKRVGYVLEQAGVTPRRLGPLRILPMTGYRPLDPTRPARGARNQRWGLIDNLAAPTKPPC
jgi:predicted transcriptional regulator of viral defense system